MAATAATTPSIDLSALFKDAWRLARASAVASACSVRACLGSGLKTAWARARAALSHRKAAATLRERIAINDRLMVETQAEIDAGWGIFAREPSELYAHLDRLHDHGIQMRDELAELEAPAAPPAPATAPVQLCLIEHIAALPPVAPATRRFEAGPYTTITVPGGGAAAGEDEMTVLLTDTDGTVRTLGSVLIYTADWDGPQAVLAEALRVIEEASAATPVVPQPEPAPAPGPDLSTVEGLRAVLVGRTANLALQGGEAPYTVVGVERWTSPDGALVRDYIKMETTGFLADNRKGPIKLHIVRDGSWRGPQGMTKAGRAVWDYGRYCDSGTKRSNADDVVREILGPIA